VGFVPFLKQAVAFFVTRAKDNMQFARQSSRPVVYPSGVRSDQIGKSKLRKARADYPQLLRKVRCFDADAGAIWCSSPTTSPSRH
jgi:hypothetical protein